MDFGESKVMALDVEDGPLCEISVDRRQLELVWSLRVRDSC